MTTRDATIKGYGVASVGKAQDLCDYLDDEGLSNRKACRILGMDEKTLKRLIDAPSDAPLSRTLTLALAAARQGIKNL